MCAAIFILFALLLAALLLGFFGKNTTALTLLRAGEHMLEPDESLGIREGKRLPGGAARHERRVTPLMKKKIGEKYDWTCNCGCGERLTFDYHVDHILPLWQGGTNAETNLQPLNPRCHSLKTSLENQRS